MVSFSDQIPKKSRKEAKHCALCKKHGDAQNTHNMRDCRKYGKDGTLKRAFAGKSAQHNPRNRNALHKHNNSYAQLSVKIAKLEKSNKKLNRTNKSASMIVTATATTPIHLEVMGMVALGI
jgi:hypothetical protein